MLGEILALDRGHVRILPFLSADTLIGIARLMFPQECATAAHLQPVGDGVSF